MQTKMEVIDVQGQHVVLAECGSSWNQVSYDNHNNYDIRPGQVYIVQNGCLISQL